MKIHIRTPRHFGELRPLPLGTPINRWLPPGNYYEDPVDDGTGTVDDGTVDDGANEFDFAAPEHATTKFKFPGVDKAMTGAEYAEHVKTAYVPKATHDAFAGKLGQIAEAVTKLTAGQQKVVKPQGQRTQAQQVDSLAALEQAELLSGKDVAAVLRQIENSTISPLTRAVLAMGERLKELSTREGGRAQADDDTMLMHEFGQIAKGLKLPEENIPGSDIVTRMISDFFYSHDPGDQKKLRADSKVFGEGVKKHFDAARKYFRELEKAELTAANKRARQRIFVTKAGGASANGKGKRLRSNSDAAAALFGEASPT